MDICEEQSEEAVEVLFERPYYHVVQIPCSELLQDSESSFRTSSTSVPNTSRYDLYDVLRSGWLPLWLLRPRLLQWTTECASQDVLYGWLFRMALFHKNYFVSEQATKSLEVLFAREPQPGSVFVQHVLPMLPVHPLFVIIHSDVHYRQTQDAMESDTCRSALKLRVSQIVGLLGCTPSAIYSLQDCRLLIPWLLRLSFDFLMRYHLHAVRAGLCSVLDKAAPLDQGNDANKLVRVSASAFFVF